MSWRTVAIMGLICGLYLTRGEFYVEPELSILGSFSRVFFVASLSSLIFLLALTL